MLGGAGGGAWVGGWGTNPPGTTSSGLLPREREISLSFTILIFSITGHRPTLWREYYFFISNIYI